VADRFSELQGKLDLASNKVAGFLGQFSNGVHTTPKNNEQEREFCVYQ